MPDSAQPRVFISHSIKDKPFISSLAADLKAAGCDVWVEKNKTDVGDSTVWVVGDGLRDSDFLILAISRSSMASDGVRQEFESALVQQVSDKNIKVLPIRLDDSEVPTILSHTPADFTKGYNAAFGELLSAIWKTPVPATTATVPLAISEPVVSDRDWAVRMLEGMTSRQLSQVITRLPNASQQVNEHNSPVDVAIALMRFAESSAGPGVIRLVEAVKEVSGKSPPRLPVRC